MDLGLSFTKYVVFFFNFLCAMIGIAMISVGIVVRTKLGDFSEFFEGLEQYPILLIIAGCVVFLIAFLGCCGAIKEDTCMLYLYSIVLMIIVAVEIGFVVGAFMKKADLDSMVDKKMHYLIERAKPNTPFYESWNLVQEKLKCCGVDSSDDWEKYQPNFQELPKSCCGEHNYGICTKLNAFKDGCKPALIEFLKNNILTVGGIAIGVAFVELLAIIFSCCLYSAYRRAHHHTI